MVTYILIGLGTTLGIILLIALALVILQLHKLKADLLTNQLQNSNDLNLKLDQKMSDLNQRLLLIDEAQKRLADVSNNLLSLQDILNDKRSRGAFGEVQLNALIQNMLPSKNYAMQHQLSNGLRCDCILFLPEPTGNIVIDSKFPLENFQGMHGTTSEHDKKRFCQNFTQDLKKHINDIATKYIVSGETADGAIMFIPAEAIFAEIHSNFPDIVQYAYDKRVWLTSPTTMMAVLTTASAVLKDNATREHVHFIQEHLRLLAKDFSLFDDRMQKLAKHIELANTDTKQIQISSEKITKRFSAIEKVELEEL